MKFDRRETLKLLGAGAAGFLALGDTQKAAGQDKAENALKLQGAGYYPFKIGDISAALVSDGGFPFNPPYPLFGANASEEQVRKALDQAFIPYDHVMAHVNTLLLRSGKDIVLIDSGCGTLFGPTTGKAITNLARAGVQPADVTAVVISHAHGDHVGGLLDAKGIPVFPNAQHFVHKDELAFWTAPNVDLSRSTAPAEMKKSLVAVAAKTFAALRGKIEPFENGKRIVEGIEVVAAPGHTPGHSAFVIASGKSQLFYITDAAHHVALNMPHPGWHVGFDTDPIEAAKTRRKIFDRAAADRVLVSGAHLPFPALGHVRATGGAFEWAPSIWEWSAE
jgi:glyoxylase-like metal-dependent hydrolase (beta-lactamase superfamily II)